jgi:hypothetical protein
MEKSSPELSHLYVEIPEFGEGVISLDTDKILYAPGGGCIYDAVSTRIAIHRTVQNKTSAPRDSHIVPAFLEGESSPEYLGF